MEDQPFLPEEGDFVTISQVITTYLQRRRLITKGDRDGQHAHQLLQQYGSERVFQTAVRMLTSEHPETRGYGAEMVLRSDRQRGVPLILPLLSDPLEGVRAEVCSLLHDLGDARAVDSLTKVLREDSSPTVRYLATDALETVGDERALPALEWAAQHDEGTDWEGRPIAWSANTAKQSIQERLQKEKG
jgi:hypothetical protein